MGEVKLKEAGTGDISAISELAAMIWRQHYPSIISHEQIDYMLNLMYSAESLKEQMETKKHRFFLITVSGVTIGFVSASSEKEGEWFLHKFYIDQLKAAKGAGSRAFGELLDIIGPSVIRLTVNRQNFKSINFYFKNGFIIERVADFDIGNGYVMNDFVMIRNGARGQDVRGQD